uniref:ATP synthase F0 subunit 8 n=1 Tax=Ancoracysta twista TaxID=2044563 RepID=A0A2H4R8D3_9EUKA|nr:ATP synthase F0 subunit 8 [Ancoracysta twista]ATY40906.1 ATP synthase F0 subunit 8 [Ancoracysta twista]
MPQLDHVTFMSQLFWLILFFLTFYVITLKYLLPSLGKALKIRKKRLEAGHKGVDQLKSEEHAVVGDYETLLMQSMVESRQFIASSLEESEKWLQTSLKEANNSASLLKPANQSYLKTLASIHGYKSFYTGRV